MCRSRKEALVLFEGQRRLGISASILMAAEMVSERRLLAAMIPEVFECPRCERQFIIDDVPDTGTEDVHCPQCSRFLGVRDIAFVLRSELDELIERLSYEKDRLEKDEAIYGLTDCDAEMKFYGREVSRVVGVLRGALKELRHLREDYRVK
jgi:DNA-directed RNA polymerase subunit RPC12/RpoP